MHRSVIGLVDKAKFAKDASRLAIGATTDAVKGVAGQARSITTFAKWALLLSGGGIFMYGAAKLVEQIHGTRDDVKQSFRGHFRTKQ